MNSIKVVFLFLSFWAALINCNDADTQDEVSSLEEILIAATVNKIVVDWIYQCNNTITWSTYLWNLLLLKAPDYEIVVKENKPALYASVEQGKKFAKDYLIGVQEACPDVGMVPDKEKIRGVTKRLLATRALIYNHRDDKENRSACCGKVINRIYNRKDLLPGLNENLRLPNREFFTYVDLLVAAAPTPELQSTVEDIAREMGALTYENLKKELQECVTKEKTWRMRILEVFDCEQEAKRRKLGACLEAYDARVPWDSEFAEELRTNSTLKDFML